MSVAYSMTGFAAVDGAAGDGCGFSLTIKGVNHRFLDLQMRLPHWCEPLEMPVRKLVKEQVRRGHVEVSLQVDRRTATGLRLDAELLGQYVEAYRSAAKAHRVTAEMDLNGLLRMPGVMSAESAAGGLNVEEFHAAVMGAMGPLLEKFNEARAEEGAALVAELREGMVRLRGLAGRVAELRADVREAQFARLRERMTELLQGAGVSEERLLAEAALMAERSDVEEEIVRLQTHVERFVAMLEEGGELGKRLDFLVQELNREANTMLSKTSGAASGNGLEITELGLAMKTEIERAKEQVQNLE